jgi:hypothetical protein
MVTAETLWGTINIKLEMIDLTITYVDEGKKCGLCTKNA